MPPNELPDVSFHMTMPNEFKRFGKDNIGLTAGIEVNKCTENFISGCNLMDLIIVPSQFSKDTILNTHYGALQCNTPVEVVFEGYPAELGKSESSTEVRNLLDSIEETFCFLYVGQWTEGNDRKNINGLIKTFYDTFKNFPTPPALVLKMHGLSYSIKDELKIQETIDKIRKSFLTETLPSIYLLYGNKTHTELATMYSHDKIKCMTSFTRGEGFGRPLLEASLHAIPIITTKWSGQLDFLDKKYTKLITGKLIKAEGLGELAPPDAQWYDIDCNLATSAFLDIVDRYEIHKKRATKLAEINKREYSLEKMFDEYDKVLENYLLMDSHPNLNIKTNIQ